MILFSMLVKRNTIYVLKGITFLKDTIDKYDVILYKFRL